MRRLHAAWPCLGWLVTRLPLVLIALSVLPYPWPHTVVGDLELYQSWGEVLRHGRFPTDDVNWQYPPAAALVMLAPWPLPGGYLGGFVTLGVLADAAVLGLLVHLGRRQAAAQGGSRQGAWLWVAGVPLLGAISYARYDLLVAAVAVAALAALAPLAGTRRGPLLGGALIGAGAMLKVWPALLLFGVECGRRTRLAAGAALLAGAGTMAAVALSLPGSADFLGHQRGRGIQIESVPGSVFLVARQLGWDGANPFRYGAREFVGPGAGVVSMLAPVLTLAVLAWLFWWRRRVITWTPGIQYDAALTATLLAVVTSRVLSPQYLLWLLALGAVCLTRRDSGQRAVCALLLVATALTQLEFPVLWGGVIRGDLPADLVLLTRNAVLVWAAVLSARALWRAGHAAPATHTEPAAAMDIDRVAGLRSPSR